jgi:hypothetical protein
MTDPNAPLYLFFAIGFLLFLALGCAIGDNLDRADARRRNHGGRR